MYRTNYYVAPETININRSYLWYRYIKYCINVMLILKWKKLKQKYKDEIINIICWSLLVFAGLVLISYVYVGLKQDDKNRQIKSVQIKQEQIFLQNQYNHCEPYHDKLVKDIPADCLNYYMKK